MPSVAATLSDYGLMTVDGVDYRLIPSGTRWLLIETNASVRRRIKQHRKLLEAQWPPEHATRVILRCHYWIPRPGAYVRRNLVTGHHRLPDGASDLPLAVCTNTFANVQQLSPRQSYWSAT